MKKPSFGGRTSGNGLTGKSGVLAGSFRASVEKGALSPSVGCHHERKPVQAVATGGRPQPGHPQRLNFR